MSSCVRIFIFCIFSYLLPVCLSCFAFIQIFLWFVSAVSPCFLVFIFLDYPMRTPFAFVHCGFVLCTPRGCLDYSWNSGVLYFFSILDFIYLCFWIYFFAPNHFVIWMCSCRPIMQNKTWAGNMKTQNVPFNANPVLQSKRNWVEHVKKSKENRKPNQAQTLRGSITQYTYIWLTGLLCTHWGIMGAGHKTKQLGKWYEWNLNLTQF